MVLYLYYILINKKAGHTLHRGYSRSLDKAIGIGVLNFKETLDNFFS